MLLKAEIIDEYNKGRIVIEPFNIDNVGPNSYDVSLSDTLKVYTSETLDVKKVNPTRTIKIPEEGLFLEPFKLYLGATIEKAGSDYYIPGYDGRSSQAINGIMSHVSAGLGYIGFKSNWTLEILVIHPIRVYAGMRIGQVFFTDVNQKFNIPSNRYNGKYTDQPLPQASKSYLDWDIPSLPQVTPNSTTTPMDNISPNSTTTPISVTTTSNKLYWGC